MGQRKRKNISKSRSRQRVRVSQQGLQQESKAFQSRAARRADRRQVRKSSNFQRLKHVFLAAGIVVLMGLLIFALTQCRGCDGSNGSDCDLNDTIDANIDLGIADGSDDYIEAGTGKINTIPKAIQRKPFVFCGNENPLHAEVISYEEALSYLALVNRCFRVPYTFSPHDLSPLRVRSTHTQEGDYHLLRESAARAAEQLFQAATDEGLTLIARSGYRSYDVQTFVHDNVLYILGIEEGSRVSAVPGHSEHQLGLALDVSSPATGGELTEIFSQTEEGKWLRDNAHYFGFIIRYPYNKEAYTGYVYEPWHIRFVGTDAAREIFNSGQILEEFLWANYVELIRQKANK